MARNKISDQLPILSQHSNGITTERENDGQTSQDGMNQYYEEYLRLRNGENNWIVTDNRYGGETRKKRDIAGNWEYHTTFESGEVVDENIEIINNILTSKKIICLTDEKVICELSILTENNQIEQWFKLYENKQSYVNDLKALELSTFTQMKQKATINSAAIISAVGIIPLVVFARTAQRVFSVNITDGKDYIFADWTSNILDVIDEKTQYNLMMASADRGFLVICVSLFYKVLVQINSIFKFYHKMSNCCISILNRHCSFFCYIFNC